MSKEKAEAPAAPIMNEDELKAHISGALPEGWELRSHGSVLQFWHKGQKTNNDLELCGKPKQNQENALAILDLILTAETEE